MNHAINVGKDSRKMSEEQSEYSKHVMYQFTEGYNGEGDKCSCGGRANCFMTGKGWICVKCFEEAIKKK